MTARTRGRQSERHAALEVLAAAANVRGSLSRHSVRTTLGCCASGGHWTGCPQQRNGTRQPPQAVMCVA